MATIKLYLDSRHVRKNGTSSLKLSINCNGSSALIPLDIYIEATQWDARFERVINHPNKQSLNTALTRSKLELEQFILHLADIPGTRFLSATELKNRYIASKHPAERVTFEQGFLSFIELKRGSTKSLYEFTLSRLKAAFPKLSSFDFEDITPRVLERFDAFLAETAPSQNYRNIHLRNIRAVFNHALDSEFTNYYPFRRFKIRPVPTRKRALTVDSLRQLFDYPTEPYAVIYRDLFKLIFMLIGINTVDLHRLTSITDEGRIEYTRAKTHRLYSIKVEPEAAEIIEKYRGKKGLLTIADRWSDHRNFRHQINKALQLIGAEKNKGGRLPDGSPKVTDSDNKPRGLWPELTTYWARHSWATIAAYLDIPKETIAAALGHGGNTVTDIYIDFDQRKVDAANRRVLDYVLYGKE